MTKHRSKSRPAKDQPSKPRLPERGMVDRLTDNRERAEIRERYAKGDSILELSRRYNRSEAGIRNLCADLVDARRSAESKAIAQRNAEIRKSHAEGETTEELARRYNLSKRAVDHICEVKCDQ